MLSILWNLAAFIIALGVLITGHLSLISKILYLL